LPARFLRKRQEKSRRGLPFAHFGAYWGWKGSAGISHPDIRLYCKRTMFSPRRTAQFGLFATVVVLVSSFGALVARNIDANRAVVRLGRVVPNFVLNDLDGRAVSLASLRGKVVVVYFNSVRCAVCNDYAERVLELAHHYNAGGQVAFLAIDSDLADGEMADLDELRVQNRILGQSFPTLLDPHDVVAELFKVTQAPCFYVIDGKGILRYRGAFDDDRVEARVTRHYVADALRQLLAGEHVALATTPLLDGDPIH
jgi:peroxiredoxin